MSERVSRLAPLALVLVITLALLPTTDLLELGGSPDAAAEVAAALDELPQDAVVLVGFDPDLGTYAEIRPTVRALLADMLERGVSLVFISLTPEGRALAIAERSSLVARDVAPQRVIDAGFVPGAEAALVRLAGAVRDGSAGMVDGLPEAPIALGLVVGGNDLGPRSWVEQFEPRVEGVDLIAVAPSVLLPELLPYVQSGQLRALLATPGDGAEYRASVQPENFVAAAGPRPLAILVGMLAAIGVLGFAVVSRLGEVLRSSRGGEAA